ncbi:MAG: PAS domain S-box protein [Planctomycetes bacterium]|nr:PAS domain S-box protein [Planctomycetota bacterium]
MKKKSKKVINKLPELPLEMAQFAMDHATEAVFWMESDAHFIYVNKAACQVLGYSKKELLTMTIHDIDSDFSKEVWPDHWKEFKDKGSLTIETYHKTKDGRLFPVEVVANFLEFDHKQYNCTFARDITKHKKTELSLRLSEQCFRAIADYTYYWEVWVSSEGVPLWTNPAIERITGYTIHEFMKMPEYLTPVVFQEDRDKVQRAIRSALKGGTGTEFEFRLQKKDGTVIWADMSWHPIYNDKGISQGHRTSIRDITDRKQAQDSLHFRHEFETLVTGISTDFINIQLDKIDDAINRALESIAEFVGIDRSYIFLFSDDQNTMSNTHEWCREGISIQIERLQNIPVNSLPWFMEHMRNFKTCWVPRVSDLPEEAKAEKDEWQLESIQSLICVPMVCHQSLIGFVGFDAVRAEFEWNEDIVKLLRIIGEIFANAIDRQLTGQQLRSSEKRYRTLVESIGFGITLVDKDHNIVMVNSAMAKMFGTPAPEFVGKKCYSKFEQQDQICPHCPGQKAMKSGQIEDIETESVRPDGSRFPVRLKAFPLFDENGKSTSFIELIEDITERKLAEQALRDSEKKYHDLVETMNEGMEVTDENFNFTYVNARFAEMLGYKPKDMIGHALVDFVDESHKKLMANQMNKRQKGQAGNFDLIWNAKDGHKVYTIASPKGIFDDDGNFMGSFGVITDITARKLTEQALLESEDRLRDFFRNAPIGFHILGPDRIITDINEDGLKMIGYTHKEIAGKKTWADLIIPQQRQQFEKHWHDIITKGLVKDLEYTLVTKDGRNIDVILNASSRFDEDGNFINTRGSVLNITKRKQTEENLQRMSNQLRILLTAAQRLNTILKVPAVMRELVFSAMELTQATSGTAGQVQNGRMVFTEYNNQGEIIPIDYSFEQGYGVPGWVLETKAPYITNDAENDPHVIPEIREELGFYNLADVPILGRTGEILGCFEIHNTKNHRPFDEMDIEMLKGLADLASGALENALLLAERKDIEENLRRSQRMLQLVMDSVPARVFWKDRNSVYLGCNKMLAKDAGFDSPEQIIGKNDYDLPWAEQADLYRSDDKQVIETGKSKLNYEEPQTTKDGKKLWLQTSKIPLKNLKDDIIGVLGTYEDITKRKIAEKMRDELNKELQAKNKELESILFVASHDLRSPLVNIQGFSHELANDCALILSDIKKNKELLKQLSSNAHQALNDSIPEALDYILNSTDKMDLLLAGLLRLSRLGSAAIKTKTLNMNMILNDVLLNMEYQIKETGTTVNIENLPDCAGDTNQINQVFSNLLDNAVKYLDESRDGMIDISGKIEDGQSIYCIADNGVGIASRHQNKIFEIFHRLEPEGKTGEGLGLTIVRRILDKHNGKIWIESKSGKGTKFFVSLPTA